MMAVLSILLACPVCWGDPNSDLVVGAKAGVLFLLVVIVGVLFAIAMIARSWARRAREIDAKELAYGLRLTTKRR